MRLQPNDIIEIHQLLSLYGHVADATVGGGSRERFREVFTPDAVFDSTDAPVGRVYEGVDAIGQMFLRTDPPHTPVHLQTNFYAWEEDGVVRAISKWFGINRVTGRLQCGDYADVLVQTPDGWRIRERLVICRWWDGGPPDEAAVR